MVHKTDSTNPGSDIGGPVYRLFYSKDISGPAKDSNGDPIVGSA